MINIQATTQSILIQTQRVARGVEPLLLVTVQFLLEKEDEFQPPKDADGKTLEIFARSSTTKNGKWVKEGIYLLDKPGVITFESYIYPTENLPANRFTATVTEEGETITLTLKSENHVRTLYWIADDDLLTPDADGNVTFSTTYADGTSSPDGVDTSMWDQLSEEGFDLPDE